MKTRNLILILFLAISISTSLGVSIFSSTVANDIVTQDVFGHLSSISSIKETQINNLDEQNIEHLDLMTSRTQLRLSLTNYSIQPTNTTQELMTTILNDALKSTPHFVNIFLINSSGIVVASTKESFLFMNYSTNYIFLKGSIQNHVDFFFKNPSNVLYEYLAGPVILNNKFLGVLVITSSVNELLSIVQDYTGLGKTGEILLLKKENDSKFVFLTPTRFDKYASLNKTVDHSYCSCLTSFNHTTLSNQRDYRNATVLLSARYIASTDWILIVKIDQNEAFQNINFLKMALIFINIIAIILIVFVSLVISSYLSKPIRKISDTADKYAKGDLKYRTDIRSTDEITKLSHTMNLMASNLEIAYSDLENTMSQLYQSQKMEALGRMAGGIAHDFNNLLTVILGYCELVQIKIEPNSPILQEFLQIKNASLKAKAITSQLLVLSRRNVVKIKNINLKELIVSFLETIRTLFPEDISIKLDLENSLCTIDADKNQMEQIILNLLLNSKEAISGRGTIELTISLFGTTNYFDYGSKKLKPGKYVELSVSDDGSGIDPSHLEHIFEPFWTTKESGSGLGLSIVYSMVEQNKGAIKIISAIGQGTKFSIIFPYSIPTLNTTTKLENNFQIPYGSSEEIKIQSELETNIQTILIVDDDEPIRNLIEIILKQHGFLPFVAENTSKAQKIFLENDIDLLITDIVMPNVNGFELAEKLTAIKKQEFKILFITGYDKYSELNSIKVKAKVLFKPFRSEDLIKAILELS